MEMSNEGPDSGERNEMRRLSSSVASSFLCPPFPFLHLTEEQEDDRSLTRSKAEKPR